VSDRTLAMHVGGLVRPPELLDRAAARERGEPGVVTAKLAAPAEGARPATRKLFGVDAVAR
jgi:hypothetical protein